jgi:hypothetical protein
MTILKWMLGGLARKFVIHFLHGKYWLMVGDARRYMPDVEESDPKYRYLKSADKYISAWELELAMDDLVQVTAMFEEDGLKFPVEFWKLMAEIAAAFSKVRGMEHYAEVAAVMEKKVEDGKGVG